MTLALLLGALASLCYGSGDFAGGVAARRAPAIVITCFSGLGALAVLVLGLALTRGTPTPADLAWGAAAGACGAAGATLIYWALALGPVSLASPLVCIIALVLPVLVGVALGERPTPRAWTGVALAVLAIPLLAQTGTHAAAPSRAHVRRTMVVATAAGLVAGAFLVCVARVGTHAGMGPLVLARSVSVAILAVLVLAQRRPLLPAAAARGPALAAGALDSTANVAFWFAVQGGNLALVAALVSLAPATTVVLARLFQGERWTAAQAWGLGVALSAGTLISLG